MELRRQYYRVMTSSPDVLSSSMKQHNELDFFYFDGTLASSRKNMVTSSLLNFETVFRFWGLKSVKRLALLIL